MRTTIDRKLQADLMARGFSRRALGRAATLMTGAAALPFFNESALAQGLSALTALPEGAIRINANENPLGPCPEALEAMYSKLRDGGRYNSDQFFVYQKTQADVDGLKPSYVLPFPGSSLPLHYAILAFCGKDRPLVTADPTYEAGERAAAFVGVKTVKVPLNAAHGHDVRALAKAHATPGMIYICNPNNPTGTITPREDIEWLVNNKPKGAIVLLDEAYIHWSEEKHCADLVSADKDLIILRTFSKIYGMAGLRAGAALARPDLLDKINNYMAGALPSTGLVGATASLKSRTLVAERRAYIAGIRNDLYSWLTKKNMKFTPAVSNCFMINVGRPSEQVIEAMMREKVIIGRKFPSWPQWVRVTIGKKDEMAAFQKAFDKVMA